MAYETITIDTLNSRVAFQLTGSATVDSTMKTEIQHAINYVVRDMVVSTDYPSFRTDATLTTAASTSDYALAVDFYRIIEPSVKFTAAPKQTLQWIDQQEWDRLEGDQFWSSTQRPYYYTIRNRDTSSGQYQLRLFPTPDDAYAMQYTYFAIPADIASASTGTVLDKRFPPEFHRALWLGACTLFPQYLSRDQLAMFKAELEAAKRAMRSKAPPVVGRQHWLKPYRPRHAVGPYTYDLSGNADYLDSQGNSL